jgi:hypothetical protein
VLVVNVMVLVKVTDVVVVDAVVVVVVTVLLVSVAVVLVPLVVVVDAVVEVSVTVVDVPLVVVEERVVDVSVTVVLDVVVAVTDVLVRVAVVEEIVVLVSVTVVAVVVVVLTLVVVVEIELVVVLVLVVVVELTEVEDSEVVVEDTVDVVVVVLLVLLVVLEVEVDVVVVETQHTSRSTPLTSQTSPAHSAAAAATPCFGMYPPAARQSVSLTADSDAVDPPSFSGFRWRQKQEEVAMVRERPLSDIAVCWLCNMAGDFKSADMWVCSPHNILKHNNTPFPVPNRAPDTITACGPPSDRKHFAVQCIDVDGGVFVFFHHVHCHPTFCTPFHRSLCSDGSIRSRSLYFSTALAIQTRILET